MKNTFLLIGERGQLAVMNHLVMEIIDKMLINVTTNCFKMIDIKKSPQFNFLPNLH